MAITSPGSRVMTLADEFDQLRNAEYQVRGVGALLDLAIDAGLDISIRRIDTGNPRPKGGEGVEALGPRPLAVLLLEVASCDVVEAGVSQNVFFGLISSYGLAALAYHDSKLALVVHPLARLGHDYLRSRADDGRWRLQKEYGLHQEASS